MSSPRIQSVIGGIVLAAFVLGMPAAARQPSSFTFGAAGDFAFGSSFKLTVAAIKAEKTDLFLALGDLSYSRQEQRWCDHWKTVQVPNLLLIAGNHDTNENAGGDINNYVKHCSNPLSATVNGVYGKQYFLDYPASAPLARFIMISPGVEGSFLGIDAVYNRGRQGYTFTESAIDDARSKGIRWIVVGMHKNYISPMEKANEISLDTTFMNMLLYKKVDVILQGHEHGYARSKQVTLNTTSCAFLATDKYNNACVVDGDDALVKGAGTVIQIIGTGGKTLRGLWTSDPEYPYFAKADVATYGFGKFTVTPSKVSFDFRRSTGGGLKDSFSITEPPPAAPADRGAASGGARRHP